MTHEIIRGIIAILSCDACDFGAEHNIPLILHKLTRPRTPPCSQKGISIILLIMIAHDRADGLGCLPTVIKWNTGAVVVHNVSLSINMVTRRIYEFGMHLEDVVEYVSTDEPKIAVHSRGGAALKVLKIERSFSLE